MTMMIAISANGGKYEGVDSHMWLKAVKRSRSTEQPTLGNRGRVTVYVVAVVEQLVQLLVT